MRSVLPSIYMLSLNIFAIIPCDGTNTQNIAASLTTLKCFQLAGERTQEKGSSHLIDSFVKRLKNLCNMILMKA